MPAQKRLGFENDGSVSPMSPTTRPKQEPETVGGAELQWFGLLLQDDGWMAKERVLRQEFGCAPRESACLAALPSVL